MFERFGENMFESSVLVIAVTRINCGGGRDGGRLFGKLWPCFSYQWPDNVKMYK